MKTVYIGQLTVHKNFFNDNCVKKKILIFQWLSVAFAKTENIFVKMSPWQKFKWSQIQRVNLPGILVQKTQLSYTDILKTSGEKWIYPDYYRLLRDSCPFSKVW